MYNIANHKIGDPVCTWYDEITNNHQVYRILALPVGECARSDMYRQLLAEFGGSGVDTNEPTQFITTGGSTQYPLMWTLPFNNGRYDVLTEKTKLPGGLMPIETTSIGAIGDILSIEGDNSLWFRGEDIADGFYAYSLDTRYTRQCSTLDNYKVVASPNSPMFTVYYEDATSRANRELMELRDKVTILEGTLNSTNSARQQELDVVQSQSSFVESELVRAKEELKKLKRDDVDSSYEDVRIKPRTEERRPSLGDLTVTDCYITREEDE